MQTILKVTDVKGDKGKFQAKADADISAAMVTFLTGKSYVGGSSFSNVSTGVLGSPKPILQTAVEFNDLDVKAVIILRDMRDPENQLTRRLIIPAPIIDVENGICTVLAKDERQIPAIPPDGAAGKGGNTIASEYCTMVGATAGSFTFESGGFIKLKK